MSNIVQPGVVHLVLPKKAAAAKACRKLLAMPNSPERIADMINKLSNIMFQDEENKFTRYEWILLILEKIFQNEPFSEDLEAFLDDAQDTVKVKDDAVKADESHNIDGVDFRDEDFSDLGIPDFDELFVPDGQFGSSYETRSLDNTSFFVAYTNSRVTPDVITCIDSI